MNAKVMIFLRGFDPHRNEEKHEDFIKHIEIPFLPYPGMDFTFPVVNWDKFPEAVRLTLTLEDYSTTYKVEKDELILVFRLGFPTPEEFDTMCEMLVSSYGFKR